MAALGGEQHLVGEAGGVVGAEHRDGRAEGAVEQHLVPAALLELGLAASRPGRFAEAAEPGAGAGEEEVAPGREQAGGVASLDLDLGEDRQLRVGAELAADQLTPLERQRHEDRLAGLEPGADEGDRPGEEIVGVGVEERLVMKLSGLGHGQVQLGTKSSGPPASKLGCR